MDYLFDGASQWTGCCIQRRDPSDGKGDETGRQIHRRGTPRGEGLKGERSTGQALSLNTRVAAVPSMKVSSVSTGPSTKKTTSDSAPVDENVTKQGASLKILKDKEGPKRSDSCRRRSSVAPQNLQKSRSSVAEKRELLFDRELDAVIERQIQQRV